MQMKHDFEIAKALGSKLAAVVRRGGATQPGGAKHRVALFDAVSGRIHSVAGQPVTVETSDPEAAAESLLRNRDPRVWSTRVLQ